MRGRRGAAIWLMVVPLVLAACGGGDAASTPTPMNSATPSRTATATPDSRITPTVTLTASPVPLRVTPLSTWTPTPRISPTPFRRQTLPASWTPTLTATATATRTPTLTPTITQTPSITPTRTVDEICDGFVVTLLLFEGVSYSRDDSAGFFISSDVLESLIVFEAVGRVSGEVVERQFVGGLPNIGVLDLSIFPVPDTYDWTISLFTVGQPGLCEQGGSFVIRPDTLLDQMLGAQPTATATP